MKDARTCMQRTFPIFQISFLVRNKVISKCGTMEEHITLIDHEDIKENIEKKYPLSWKY